MSQNPQSAKFFLFPDSHQTTNSLSIRFPPGLLVQTHFSSYAITFLHLYPQVSILCCATKAKPFVLPILSGFLSEQYTTAFSFTYSYPTIIFLSHNAESSQPRNHPTYLLFSRFPLQHISLIFLIH